MHHRAWDCVALSPPGMATLALVATGTRHYLQAVLPLLGLIAASLVTVWVAGRLVDLVAGGYEFGRRQPAWYAISLPLGLAYGIACYLYSLRLADRLPGARAGGGGGPGFGRLNRQGASAGGRRGDPTHPGGRRCASCPLSSCLPCSLHPQPSLPRRSLPWTTP